MIDDCVRSSSPTKLVTSAADHRKTPLFPKEASAQTAVQLPLSSCLNVELTPMAVLMATRWPSLSSIVFIYSHNNRGKEDLLHFSILSVLSVSHRFINKYSILFVVQYFSYIFFAILSPKITVLLPRI